MVVVWAAVQLEKQACTTAGLDVLTREVVPCCFLCVTQAHDSRFAGEALSLTQMGRFSE